MKAEKKLSAKHGIVCRLPGDPLGYFGWPSVARMDDGTLAVASSGLRGAHICPWGKTVLNISKDDGVTWSPPRVIQDSMIDDRDAGIVNLGGKKLLVSWFRGDTRKHDPAKWMSPDEVKAWNDTVSAWTDDSVKALLGSWIMLSADGGETWDGPINVPVSAPHGPIRLSSGDLFYLGKDFRTDRPEEEPSHILAARSKDGGGTWEIEGTVPVSPGTDPANYHEPHVVELSNGALLGMIRIQNQGEHDLAASGIPNFSLMQTLSYNGKTWSMPRPLGFHGSPPHLMRHSSGALVLTYGYRGKPFGQRVAFSWDDGATWEHDWILRDDGPSGDLGYPATVELADGSLFSVYYQKAAGNEHCSVLWSRWTLPPQSKPQRTVRLDMGEPVTVAMAPPDVRGWGPWQFPHLARLPDGQIQLSFHVEADSATAYGLPPAVAVSKDEGRTWTMLPREECGNSPNSPLRIANGEWLGAGRLRPIPMADLTLPDKPFFRLEELPEKCRAGWPLRRLRAGEKEWGEEQATVNLPGETRSAASGVLVLPYFDALFAAPDGSLWSVNYTSSRRILDGERRPHSAMMILRSTDLGMTWNLWSEIPYQPDPLADPDADRRNGFTEPTVNFMPDGSVFCLLRTHDSCGVGPLYWARSTDNGRTWTKPAVFDNLGVWPQMLTLRNGITLAVYGRPGLFLRATSDPAGLRWDRRMELLPPVWNTTCAYGALLPLDDDTVLAAYSEFNLPGPDGRPCKGIRVRRLTVRSE